MAGDGVDGLEPGQQVEVAAMEDGAGCDGCLAAAGGAFVGKALGGEFPRLLAAAGWANEALGPAFLEEKASAGRVVGEPLVEGGSRHGAVVFPAARHENEFRTTVMGVKPWRRYLLSDRTQGDKPLSGNRKTQLEPDYIDL